MSDEGGTRHERACLYRRRRWGIATALAIALVQALAKTENVVPVQAPGELYNVLVRKSGWPGDQSDRDRDLASLHMPESLP